MAMRGSVKLLKFKILRKGFPCLGAFSLSAFPRFMSSATSSSATSDAVQQQTFLPSVSWLIHKHHLTPQIVSSIPTSGPKNRLLKGDVLAFLKDGLDSNIGGPKAYYSLDIPTNHIRSDVGKAIYLAALKALKNEKLNQGSEQVPQNKNIWITKLGASGPWSSSLDISLAKEISAASLAQLKEEKTVSIAPGSFRIVDFLGVSGNSLDSIDLLMAGNHITGNETAILAISIYSPLPHQHENVDLIDSLSGNTSTAALTEETSQKASNPVDDDILDFLTAPSTSPSSQIQLDLVVDPSKISAKWAQTYLGLIKNAIVSK